MRLLDLYCKAGGGAKGYADAGFEVVGVDIEPQPNYPFEFVQAHALRWTRARLESCTRWGMDLFGFDAIHASPPCQAFTAYQRTGRVGEYPDLIEPVRELLEATGLPYVIENVPGAPLIDPVRYCGSSFGLNIRRHRLFESNMPLRAPACDHGWQTPRFPAATNRKPNSRRTVEVGVWRIPLETQQRAMGIDWMTLEELTEAIPPAYTEHIGRQLAAALSPTVHD